MEIMYLVGCKQYRQRVTRKLQMLLRVELNNFELK